MTTTYTGWLEGALILLMLIGMIAVFYERIKRDRGPWIITIQMLTIIFVFPTIIILALEGKVKEDAAATLIGTLVGYALSKMGKQEPAGPSPQGTPPNA